MKRYLSAYITEILECHRLLVCVRSVFLIGLAEPTEPTHLNQVHLNIQGFAILAKEILVICIVRTFLDR
jgi:hypothetical protein